LKPLPGGLAHHWVGASFIPNRSIDEVLHVLSDYGRYRDFFKPTVIESKLVRHEAGRYWFTMRWRRRVVTVSAELETAWESNHWRVDGNRSYELVHSTLVQEVANPGQPGEALLPPGQGRGYIWRASGISRLEQRDGGVYLETESLVLSRDVPAGLRWLVYPIVRGLARSMIVTSLGQAREAVTAGKSTGLNAGERAPNRSKQYAN
jgi:hypothetical protein